MNPHPVALWHQLVAQRQFALLDEFLAEDVAFVSPVVHKPQQGKALTKLYLHAAFAVLFNDSFRYVREIVGEQDAMLEFTTTIDGVQINGVDILHWNAEQRVVEFKVMLRPLKAIQLVQERMAAMLQQHKPQT
ncbi:hypothetical protein SAMN04488038_111136 [Solimonas aquatica]|uniref:SnoaL-like domain-containing protein n=1 Tax=Solimonas aquatica TaxID=489703 RepID=A0A1H9JEP1_9GAMM|nr:nuclear transport factor 2 family protein [Solimonas aquatica]SEQ85394.1 hypothetical protein SAMN04488038_111136 [Solimonas aquatica]